MATGTLAPPPNQNLIQLKKLLAKGAVESQADAARRLGVSRQYVHQLVHRHGLNAPASWGRVTFDCSECGQTITRRRSELKALKHPELCSDCRRKRGPSRIVVRCRRCGRERLFPPHVARRLTSGLCRSCWARAIPKGRTSLPRVIIQCSNCGKERPYRARMAKVLKTDLCRPCYRGLGARKRAAAKRAGVKRIATKPASVKRVASKPAAKTARKTSR